MFHTHPFEEIDVNFNGGSFSASGEIQVGFFVEPADPSVGYFQSQIIIDGFGGAQLELVDDEGNITVVFAAEDSDLWKQVTKTFCDQSLIEDIIYSEQF